MAFRALVLNQGADRKVSGAVETLPGDKLPAGDVVVAIDYSTLNYKDGLVLTTGGGLVKTWPHVGGIDFAGTVETSESGAFKPGDKVVLNGYRVGELHWGGYATKARVKGDWLVKLPVSISTKHAMAIGTAGYTSMLCVIALEKHGITPAKGEILVTGAAGGVVAEAGDDFELGGGVPVTVLGHADAAAGEGVNGVNGGVRLAALGEVIGFRVLLGLHLSDEGGDGGVPLEEGHLIPSPRAGDGCLHSLGGLRALEGGFDVLGHRLLLSVG